MLPKEEMRLIAMRYFQRRTQTDIAQELGISQVQVSRNGKPYPQTAAANTQEIGL